MFSFLKYKNHTLEDLTKSKGDINRRYKNIQRVKIHTSARILEIGSGNGVFMNALHEKGFQNVQGVDMNPRHDDTFGNLDVLQCSIEAMPFEAKSFDMVLSYFVFDGKLYSRQNREKMLRKIHSVLSEDGIYICDEPIEAKAIIGTIRQMRQRANTLVREYWNETFIPAKN